MNPTPAIPEDQLPDWMKQALRGVDWGALIVVLLCLGLSIAVWWQSEGLPRTYWGDSTLFRAADVAQALREGRLYPRWSPHALRGYGAPIAHFSPPAASYVIGLTSLILGGDLILAARLLGSGALILSGAAVYSLVARRSQAALGVVAALLYTFSPISALIAPRIQGDFALLLALALWPALLWALDRLGQGMSAWDEWAVALSCAALWLCDPRMALAGVGLGLAHSLIHHRALRSATWPLLLGLGLSAFYWLPAALEAPSISWSDSPLPAFDQIFDWAALLRPPQQLDPAALLQPMQYSLGWAALALASMALIFHQRLPNDARRVVIYYGSLSLALLSSASWWMSNQTWLLGLMTLALALTGAQSLHLRRFLHSTSQRLILALACLGILSANAAVWLSPSPPNSDQRYNPLDQVSYEIQGFGVATLPQGALVPGPIDLPNEAALLNGYRNNALNRFSASPVLANQASVLENSSHRLRFQLRTTNYVETTLLLTAFEGWTAILGPTPLRLGSQADGLMRLSVPRASSEELVVGLEGTPLRSSSWLMAWLSIAILVIRSRRRRLVIPKPRLSDFLLLSHAETRLLSLALIACAIIGLALSLAPRPYSLRASFGHALRHATPLNSRSNQDVVLLAYDLPGSQRLDQPLRVTLYWQAIRPLRQNLSVRLSLQSVSSGQSIPISTPRPPASYPTRRWLRNFYLVDQHRITLEPDTPTGRYLLRVELLVCAEACDESSRATFFDSQGRVLGRAVALPQVIDIER
ncbi:MAG: hypothetical protein NZ750_00585 [Anaerolineae bacterium]|nr:hypothetical protein [Anaerolineae bacterium]MDW8173080.1 hypothetical protein [Anaerolineae bacterium]